MGILFHTQKPRRFHHELIYSDERKERLVRMEQRAKEDLQRETEGKPDTSPFTPGFMSGRYAKHRRHGIISALSSGVAVMVIVLFILVLLMIL